MQTICGGVNTDICCNNLLFKKFFSSRHHLMNHASPFKFLYKIHVISNFFRVAKLYFIFLTTKFYGGKCAKLLNFLKRTLKVIYMS